MITPNVESLIAQYQAEFAGASAEARLIEMQKIAASGLKPTLMAILILLVLQAAE